MPTEPTLSQKEQNKAGIGTQGDKRKVAAKQQNKNEKDHCTKHTHLHPQLHLYVHIVQVVHVPLQYVCHVEAYGYAFLCIHMP